MGEDRRTTVQSLEIDGKTVDLVASFSPLLKPEDSFKEAMPTDVRDRLIAYLLEHMEGGTEEELAAALGLKKWERLFEELLGEMHRVGELIIAREPRMQMAIWNVTFAMGDDDGNPDGSEIRRPIANSVYRLSPQTWIEAVA